MKSQIAQTQHGPIEYLHLGEGPTVLLCHGASADCYSVGAFKFLISSGFSLLSPSRPGYGRTPVRVGRSNRDAAGALIALLDHLGIQACSVIAVSAGGPTGIALAANFPERVKRLVLMAAISRPEDRINEPSHRDQVAFYGLLHGLQWQILKLLSNLSPRTMARQTMAIFSKHPTEDAFRTLSAQGIESIRQFYQGRSSRQGALNDLTHRVGTELLQSVSVPVLVVHSRDDKSVPFQHAEWALQHIPHAVVCESGCTGHFVWVGPEYGEICRQMLDFLTTGLAKQVANGQHESLNESTSL